jgi:SAM-dependent methyltransferase
MSPMPPVDEPSYWDARYRTGGAGWDMRTPTPVFVDLLNSRRFEPGSALVLGCGMGHDAVLFAQHGFEVTAVDFSEAALASTGELAASSKTALTVLRRDLFSLSPDFDGRFDYVVEYVTLCAVDPRRRGEFARVVCNVLKPGGRLLGLFFPLDGRPGGPPFAIREEEIAGLFGGACDLELSESPEHSVRPRKGKELLMVWRKRNDRALL